MFKKKQVVEAPIWEPPKVKKKYPKWTFARVAGTDDYYLLLSKSKMKFISERAFRSWGKPYVLVSEESISGYLNWKQIGFAQGTILISFVDDTKWFISGSDPLAGERCQITTPDLFTELGFDLRNAFVVSLDELDFHKKGENL